MWERKYNKVERANVEAWKVVKPLGKSKSESSKLNVIVMEKLREWYTKNTKILTENLKNVSIDDINIM